MMSIHLTGIQNAINNMKLDPDDFRQALTESGLKMEGDAKQMCTDMGAVDTGRLRASLSTAMDGESPKGGDKVDPPTKDPSALAVLRIGSSVEYAPYIIFGTKKMIGRDFLTPAVLNNLDDINQRIEAKIKQ